MLFREVFYHNWDVRIRRKKADLKYVELVDVMKIKYQESFVRARSHSNTDKSLVRKKEIQYDENLERSRKEKTTLE